MVKCALLINGNYRTFDRCKESILNETKFLNPDIFLNPYDKRYCYHHCVQGSIGFHGEENIRDDYFQGIDYSNIRVDSYDYFVESFNKHVLPNIHPKMVLENGSSFLQIYKWIQGIDMISKYEEINNLAYDIIILTRFDVIFNSLQHLDFSNISEKVIMNKCSMGYANDQILISTKDNLLKILNFMQYEFFNYTIPTSNDTIPHRVMKNSIDACGIVHEEHSKLLKCILRENNVECPVA